VDSDRAEEAVARGVGDHQVHPLATLALAVRLGEPLLGRALVVVLRHPRPPDDLRVPTRLDERGRVGVRAQPEANGSIADSLHRKLDRLAHGAAAKRCQVPGTPFSSCSPRSANSRSAPTTRSFTVPETSTSPGSASAPIRAPMFTAIPRTSSPANSHSPV